jgi:hypothetical protein
MIPERYRGKDVLLGILQKSIKDNWSRVKTMYDEVYDWAGRTGAEINIDTGMLREFRKDIDSDGAEFIETPDGMPSRLNLWLQEAYPAAFKS